MATAPAPHSRWVARRGKAARGADNERQPRAALVKQRLADVPGKRVHICQVGIAEDDDIAILAETYPVEVIRDPFAPMTPPGRLTLRYFFPPKVGLPIQTPKP